MLNHDDHERGVRYSYLDSPGGPRYRYVSPDYFRLVPWEGDGLKPIGYGYDSIAALLAAVRRVESAAEDASGPDALARRQRVLQEIDDAGLLATPANSSDNDRVIEAARQSLAHGGATVNLHG
jgi:hypothetical protein